MDTTERYQNICPQCGNHLNRGTTVDALIIKDNQILLIKRGNEPHKGKWALPGGYVDWNETVEQAIIREVKEEVDLEVVNLTLLGIFSNPQRHIKQAINIAFTVEIAGTPHIGDDAKECKWFSLKKLPEDLAFDHKDIIEAYSKKFPLSSEV